MKIKELDPILQRFTEATALRATVWTREGQGHPILAAYGEPRDAPPGVLPLLRHDTAPVEIDVGDGVILAAAVPGTNPVWITIGPVTGDVAFAGGMLAFLIPVVSHFFQSALEIDHAAFELGERYEEINLLYTTSEILGRTVSLEEAANRILFDIADTVGARRAAILVHDRTTDTLQVVSAIGFEAADAPPIETADERSVSARVFREQRAQVLEDEHGECDAEEPYRKGAFLSVPILWTNPDPNGAIPLGVVNLSDRKSGEPFTSGDEKLVTAIATQIGTAIQNARLVRSSIAQQRLQQEMQLANDLQMKLLPDTKLFAPEVQVAARVVPADSVGGDFYHLFRLGEGRTGVMIGDVSSHGYRAALVMALVMSASSIHAQSTADPGEMLTALLHTLRDELESTEMFVSVFYAVLDPRRGVLRYANTGHPHAFVLGADGGEERLPALDPPLGMSADPPSARERPWKAGEDLLLLFTDGISDTRDRHNARIGEEPILDIARRHRTEEPGRLLDRLFATLSAHAGDTIRRDDLTLLVARG